MTPPNDSGDESAPPAADQPEPADIWEGVDPATVTEYCRRGQHPMCHGTVFVYPPTESGDSYVRCACPVTNCGHGGQGRRNRLKRPR